MRRVDRVLLGLPAAVLLVAATACGGTSGGDDETSAGSASPTVSATTTGSATASASPTTSTSVTATPSATASTSATAKPTPTVPARMADFCNGIVQRSSGLEFHALASAGKINCVDAEMVLDTYLNHPPTRPQGSGAVVEWDGWTCELGSPQVDEHFHGSCAGNGISFHIVDAGYGAYR
jgi:hypothetical protein